MAEAWTDLLDADLAQDKPLRQSTTRALRDNPQGIAAGVPGAPKVQSAGIADGAVTTAKIQSSAVTAAKLESGERMTASNVRSAYAGIAISAVGAYAFAHDDTLSTSTGGTVAGSSLDRAVMDLSGDIIQGASFSGTWRNMGESTSMSAATTLWHRIS